MSQAQSCQWEAFFFTFSFFTLGFLTFFGVLPCVPEPAEGGFASTSELLELLLLSESEELPWLWPCWPAPLGFLEVDSRAAERSWVDWRRKCPLYFKFSAARGAPAVGSKLYSGQRRCVRRAGEGQWDLPSQGMLGAPPDLCSILSPSPAPPSLSSGLWGGWTVNCKRKTPACASLGK